MKKIFLAIVYVFAIIGFVLVAVYVAVQLGLTNTSGIIDRQHDYFKNTKLNESSVSTSDALSSLVINANEAWAKSEEWSVLKEAIVKDAPTIKRASIVTGVPARYIVATLIVEQLRLFNSDREIFKSIFAPLKILGNQSQFSWGVMGIKQDTAIQIENNLVATNSPWYLGQAFEHILDYPATTTDIDASRFSRLTDEHDRYYSYLYGALNLKEIERQWNEAGFDISNRPEILATLFNIGFQHSTPNTNPQSGGAEIGIGTTTFSFGNLASQFYYSNELIDEFPR